MSISMVLDCFLKNINDLKLPDHSQYQASVIYSFIFDLIYFWYHAPSLQSLLLFGKWAKPENMVWFSQSATTPKALFAPGNQVA
jgi:hypothetical protein